jgi:hypothetical protein
MFGAGIIAQRLAAAGGFWLQALASAVGVLSFNFQDICTTDPPAMPVFTAAELAAIPNPLIQPDNLNALQKLRDAILNLFWWDFCQCTGAATPPPAALPAAPAGAPDFSNLVNPAGPCNALKTVTGGGVTPAIGFDVTFGQSTNVQFAPSTTTIRTRFTGIPDGPAPHPNTFTLHVCVSTSGVSNCFNSPVFNWDGNEHIYDITPPSTFTGGVLLTVNTQGPFGAGDHFAAKMEAFSGCNPGVTTSPCCPADLYSNATLQQILTTVTLLQRQIAPFAYIPGTVHGAVTGNGEFAISSPLLGLRVDVPLVPGRAGQIIGDPTRYWDIGEVSLGDADGWFYRRRIDTSSLVWTPKDAQLATRIGYSIPGDVHVTLTEIKREH